MVRNNSTMDDDKLDGDLADLANSVDSGDDESEEPKHPMGEVDVSEWRKLDSEAKWVHAESTLQEKFPFLTRLGRYVGLTVTNFLYWAIIGLGLSVLSVVIVGVDEVVTSLTSFASGAGWVASFVSQFADGVFAVGIFVYAIWILSRRELLHPNWTPTDLENVPRVGPVVTWTAVSLLVSVGAGVEWFGLYDVPVVSTGVLLVGYWVSAYVLARKMNTLIRDDHWQAEWFSMETPWKWPMWTAIGYGPYMAIEGGLQWVPMWVSQLFALSVPLLGIAYLGYREVAKAGIVVSDRLMSQEEQAEYRSSEPSDVEVGSGAEEWEAEVSETDSDSEWKYE